MAIAQGFIVKILMLAMNLGTGMLSARVLGPTGRAEQAALLVGIGLFPSFLSFGLSTAIQYKLRKQPDQEQRLISTATNLAVGFGLLSVLVGYFVLPRMLMQYSQAIIQTAQLFMLAAPFTALFSVFNGVLQARSRFAAANVSQYGPLILALVTLSVLAVLHRLTPITSATTYMLTNALAACWLWVAVRPELSFDGFRESARSLLSFGLRSYITDILGTLLTQIDTILVISLLSPKSMGLYAIALSAARLSDLFSTAIVTVVFPKAVGLPRREMLDLTNRVGRLTFAVIFVTMMFNIILMPFLLPAFFGKAFVDAVPVGQILAATFILSGTAAVLAQAFLAAGKPGVIAIIQGAGILLAIPPLLILIPRFGLIGAAWGLLIATALREVVTMSCFPIVLKAPIPSPILTLGDIRFVKESLGRRMSTHDA
jgi:antigen flippase